MFCSSISDWEACEPTVAVGASVRTGTFIGGGIDDCGLLTVTFPLLLGVFVNVAGGGDLKGEDIETAGLAGAAANLFGGTGGGGIKVDSSYASRFEGTSG